MHNDDWKWYLLVAVVIIVLVFPLVRDLIKPNPYAYNADKVPKYIRDYMAVYDDDELPNAWRAGYAQGFADAVESVGDWIFDHANLEYYKIWEDGLHTGYEFAED